MTGSCATSASIQPPNAVGLGAQLADEQDRLDGATSPVPMAIATWRHSVGDNSSNFFSAASYTLTWSIGNSALRSIALFCAASSVGNTVFIRPSTSKPNPYVITSSARLIIHRASPLLILTSLSYSPFVSP